MIVALVTDPILRAALVRAAAPDEDVVWDPEEALDALQYGFPRILVHAVRDGHPGARSVGFARGDVPCLHLSGPLLRSWESRRRRDPVPRSRVDEWTQRVGDEIRAMAGTTWVEGAFRDLVRASGQALPPALRGLGRRVMEFPARYDDLRALTEVTGLSRGALKARFRRRELPSPYSYLRWFRVLAGAHVLSDPSVTTAMAAHRLGFTTGGNFCRTVRGVGGMTPTDSRSASGWNQLVVNFAWSHMESGQIAAWRTLDELFLRDVA